jgi:hypothetical protein
MQFVPTLQALVAGNLIMLEGGAANSSLSIVSCCHFHGGKNLRRRANLNLQFFLKKNFG